MIDWIKYRQQLLSRIGEFAQSAPETVKGYQMLSNASKKNNLLDAKTSELISLAVAVSIRCDGCIVVHATEALKQGATPDEIAGALGVAVAMNAGAAMVYSARALDAVVAIAASGVKT